jgi:predicted lactoylglutathione lyase
MPEKENNNLIEQQLDVLLTEQQKLELLLTHEQYEVFQQQEITLSLQIKKFMNSHSTDSLIKVLTKLQTLEKKTIQLKTLAEVHYKQLKDKSLLQQRNKNRLKAYK